jgi:hypothetical protein
MWYHVVQNMWTVQYLNLKGTKKQETSRVIFFFFQTSWWVPGSPLMLIRLSVTTAAEASLCVGHPPTEKALQTHTKLRTYISEPYLEAMRIMNTPRRTSMRSVLSTAGPHNSHAGWPTATSSSRMTVQQCCHARKNMLSITRWQHFPDENVTFACPNRKGEELTISEAYAKAARVCPWAMDTKMANSAILHILWHLWINPFKISSKLFDFGWSWKHG